MYARRCTRSWRLILSVILVAGTTPAHGGAPDSGAGERALPLPNILLLVAEDLSPRIGAYGDAVAATPHLDALASASVRFSQTFTTAGVCAPSRAALVMGQHQNSFAAGGMRTSTGPLGPYLALPPEDLKAFPELLRRAGYYTFTDQKLDYQFSGIRAGSGPFSIWTAEGADTGWWHRDPEQPFFGLINFMQTHESGVMRPTGPALNDAHAQTQQFRKAAGLNAAKMTPPSAVRLPPYYPDLPEVREDLARHYDNIHAMDAQVGRILQRLEADGLADQTIVIWTTDHGDGLPRAKRELFDSGIRVPLLMRVPDAYRAVLRQAYPNMIWTPGSVHDGLVSFVDLAPTILALAQQSAPSQLHGRNLLQAGRQAVFAARDRIDEVPDRQRAIRTDRYKYILSWQPDTPGGHGLAYRDGLAMVRAMRAQWQAGKLDAVASRWFEPPGREQLYDLRSDPHELQNLAADPAWQDLRAQLNGQLVDWLLRVGDSGAQPEATLRTRLLQDGQVPQTPVPVAQLQGGRLLAQAAHNASIGYRIDGGDWQLYTEPVAVDGDELELKAVRYGWRESPVLEVRLNR